MICSHKIWTTSFFGISAPLRGELIVFFGSGKGRIFFFVNVLVLLLSRGYDDIPPIDRFARSATRAKQGRGNESRSDYRHVSTS